MILNNHKHQYKHEYVNQISLNNINGEFEFHDFYQTGATWLARSGHDLACVRLGIASWKPYEDDGMLETPWGWLEDVVRVCPET